ncbi:MAG: ketoacyl-ACP synthase III [Ardenticatenaceae bacterium]|nr:ketoacyl-ACP synthase III [Ardenticatenaceae bacterium]MCB8990196.1 ketoacyl-ACP synthase III [Ardenticatenaceae bacterium]MCB9003013.1 ketoacyl-ACP synthase III [Ardenticatenaceae bacterium]
MRYAHIVGWGCYLPEQVLTNDDLAGMVDTSNEWIYTRTGIRERRLANEKETTATLAFEAAARALAMSKINPTQVDLIIVATSTPEFVFPSTASLLQDYLGARKAGAFDLSAACTGFIYALSLAANSIATGAVDTAVIVGAETLSRITDWQDRGTCILFGDGAGAVVLKGSDIPGGVLATTLRSDGSGGNLLSLYNGRGNAVPHYGTSYLNGHKSTIHMNGRQVFRFATSVVPESIEEVVEKAGLTMDDVSLIVPHQANQRIIDHAAKKLKLPPEKFFINLDRFGNTSAASIPIALCDAAKEGKLHPDDNLVFVGFGGGLTWGSAVVKWNVTPPPISPMRRQWRRARYVAARARSRVRQLARRLLAWIAGSPTPDARLKDADKRPEE